MPAFATENKQINSNKQHGRGIYIGPSNRHRCSKGKEKRLLPDSRLLVALLFTFVLIFILVLLATKELAEEASFLGFERLKEILGCTVILFVSPELKQS